MGGLFDSCGDAEGGGVVGSLAASLARGVGGRCPGAVPAVEPHVPARSGALGRRATRNSRHSDCAPEQLMVLLSNSIVIGVPSVSVPVQLSPPSFVEARLVRLFFAR